MRGITLGTPRLITGIGSEAEDQHGLFHGFFALSMASRRARNSLPGFHSGYLSP